MLFVLSGRTHPPPPVPPFQLTPNLSPNGMAGCDIMKLNVSRRMYESLVGKELTDKSCLQMAICDVTSGNVLGFCESRKSGTGRDGWVHPKGANSMAMSGLG